MTFSIYKNPAAVGWKHFQSAAYCMSACMEAGVDAPCACLLVLYCHVHLPFPNLRPSLGSQESSPGKA